jgi:hypothetical protein
MDIMAVGIIQLFGVIIISNQSVSIICRMHAHNDIPSVQIWWFTIGIALTVFRWIFGI